MAGAGHHWQALAPMFGVETELELHEVLTSVILCECVYKRVERNGIRGAVEAMKLVREKFPSDERMLPRLNSVQWCREGVENQKYLVAENKESLFVVLMGTKEMRDAWTDLKVNKKEFLIEPANEIVGGKGAMAVHEGFLERADSLRVEAMYRHAKSLGRRLVLAGHSLGGSVAKICALRLLFAGCDAQSIHCVCFGAPAIADKNLSDTVKVNGWSNVLKNYYTLHDPFAWILVEENINDLFGNSEKMDGFLQSMIPSMKNMVGINRYYHIGVQIVLRSPTLYKEDLSIGQPGMKMQSLSRQNWLSHHRMATYRSICANICGQKLPKRCNASSICWNTLKICSVETDMVIVAKPVISSTVGDMPLIRPGWESLRISVKIKGLSTDFISSTVLVLPSGAKIRSDCIRYPSMEEYQKGSSKHLETIVFFSQIPINEFRQLIPEKNESKDTYTKDLVSLSGFRVEVSTDFHESVVCNVTMRPTVAWIVPVDQEGVSAFTEVHQQQKQYKLPNYLLYSDGLLLMDVSRALGGQFTEEAILNNALLLLGGSPRDLVDDYHLGWYENVKRFFMNQIAWIKWTCAGLRVHFVNGSPIRQLQHPSAVSILISKQTIIKRLSAKHFAIFHALNCLSRFSFLKGISVLLACLGENTLGVMQERMIADISGIRPEIGKVLFLDTNNVLESMDTLIFNLSQHILSKANHAYSKL